MAGHLLEMLESSNIAATLHLDDIPTLAGATDAIAAGIQSSLAPSNRLAVAKVDASSAVRQKPCFDLLFDPQTCGGLLLGVAERDADQINTAVVDAGLRPLIKIGTVDELTDGNRPLQVV